MGTGLLRQGVRRMLFLWTTTKIGKIWLDGDAVKQEVVKRLPKNFYCQEVSFLGDRNLLSVYISKPEDASPEASAPFEAKLEDVFGKAGIEVQVNWVLVAPQDNPKATPVWMLPLFWACMAAALTAVVQLGLRGILWSLFAAVIGYGVSWIFLTEDGQKQVSALMEQFKR